MGRTLGGRYRASRSSISDRVRHLDLAHYDFAVVFDVIARRAG
jgi:hypothetical protein